MKVKKFLSIIALAALAASIVILLLPRKYSIESKSDSRVLGRLEDDEGRDVGGSIVTGKESSRNVEDTSVPVELEIRKTPDAHLEVFRRATRTDRRLSDYMEVLNLVHDEAYQEFATSDLWDLHEFFYQEYRRNSLRMLQLRKIRVELGKRGEAEILGVLRDEIDGSSLGTVTVALEDLGAIGTEAAISVLVDVWESGAGHPEFSEDVVHLPPYIQAAIIVQGIFPDAPVWGQQENRGDLKVYRQSNSERFRQWFEEQKGG